MAEYSSNGAYLSSRKIDATEGVFVHYKSDPADCWYDMSAMHKQVHRGPTPFMRHLYVGMRDGHDRRYVEEKPLAPVTQLIPKMDSIDEKIA